MFLAVCTLCLIAFIPVREQVEDFVINLIVAKGLKVQADSRNSNPVLNGSTQ